MPQTMPTAPDQHMKILRNTYAHVDTYFRTGFPIPEQSARAAVIRRCLSCCSTTTSVYSSGSTARSGRRGDPRRSRRFFVDPEDGPQAWSSSAGHVLHHVVHPNLSAKAVARSTVNRSSSAEARLRAFFCSWYGRSNPRTRASEAQSPARESSELHRFGRLVGVCDYSRCAKRLLRRCALL